MNDYTKLVCSVLGTFIIGATTAYNIDHNTTILAIVMAGLASVGPYLLGYWQTNPRNQPHSAERLLESVHASDLPAEVKARLAPALASETIKTPEGARP